MSLGNSELHGRLLQIKAQLLAELGPTVVIDDPAVCLRYSSDGV